MATRRPPSPGRDSLSRKDIILQMQKHITDLGLTNKVVGEVLNAFIEVYKECIIDNTRVEIRNFGVINSTLIKGRIIVHPETKEELPASPYYRLAFTPSASFKGLLREKALKDAQKQ